MILEISEKREPKLRYHLKYHIKAFFDVECISFIEDHVKSEIKFLMFRFTLWQNPSQWVTHRNAGHMTDVDSHTDLQFNKFQ